MKLTLNKLNQGPGTQVFSGRIKVSELLKHYKIDYFHETKNPDGYQRNPDKSRCKRFAQFVKTQIGSGRPLMIPTSILLSSRKKLNGSPSQGGLFIAEIDDQEHLYVVDGQHRTEGFKYAINDLGLNQLEDYELSFVLIECMDLKEEVNQFLSINTYMRKVKTDLANKLITKWSDKIPDNQKHAVYATKVTDMLASGRFPSPWEGRLKPANATKEDGQDYWNTVLSFTNSLKPILSAQAISGLKEERVAEQLGHFWSAVGQLMPQVFSENCSEYLAIKNNGFVSLHRVFVFVYSHLRYHREIKQPTANDYKSVLKVADSAFNHEYWRRDNEDGAGSYGGGFSGYAKLADAIIDELKNSGIES